MSRTRVVVLVPSWAGSPSLRVPFEDSPGRAVAYDLWVFLGRDQRASFRSGGPYLSRLECVPADAPALEEGTPGR